MYRPIFTKAAIGLIQAMQDSGSTNKEIAAAIGTTEGGLAARVSQLGLSRYPRHALGGRLRVTFPEQIFTECAPHAARRNLTASDLIRLLVNRITRDNLFEAVLDDGDGYRDGRLGTPIIRSLAHGARRDREARDTRR